MIEGLLVIIILLLMSCSIDLDGIKKELKEMNNKLDDIKDKQL